MSEKKKSSQKKRKKEQEYLEGWQRARADYENLKKEMGEKIVTSSRLSKISIAQELLPIIENFAKAVEHVPEDQQNQGWVVGIFHIQKQLEDCLTNLGFTKVMTLEEEFNPQKHEAVSREKKEGSEGKIIREISAGYEYDGKVVIPAKVIVGE